MSSKEKEKEKERDLTIELTAGQMERIMMQPEWEAIKKHAFPRKVRYWLGRMVNKIDQEMKPYFTEKQIVVDKYAEKKEDGSTITIGNQVSFGNKRKKALKELDELGSINLDFGHIKKIVIDEETAEDVDELKLSLGEETVLQHFFFQEGLDDV